MATRVDYEAPKKTGNKICVNESNGGSMTLPFWLPQIPNDNFTEALKSSLLISGAFSELTDNWEEEWGLVPQIIEVDQPFFGFNTTVKTKIRYTLFFKGKQVYELETNESGTAKSGEHFLPSERLKMANEYSVRASFKKFIDDLSKQKFEAGKLIKPACDCSKLGKLE